MTHSTYCTVAVKLEHQLQAQAAFPGMFTSLFYEQLPAADSTIATHSVTSGWFYNHELDLLCSSNDFPKQVRFGDANSAIAAMNLAAVTTLVPEPEVVPETIPEVIPEVTPDVPPEFI